MSYSAKYHTVLFWRTVLDVILLTFRCKVTNPLRQMESRNRDELFYLENWWTDPGLPGDVLYICPSCDNEFYESPGGHSLCPWCETAALKAEETMREEEYADTHYDTWAREEEEITPYV